MDLYTYLLNETVEATAPPGETEAAARTRADAIAEMLCAYDPGDGMETMLACQCIMMQFLLGAAMRDASNPRQEPALLAKARAGAISASRTLLQSVAKFENARKRNELRAAEAAKLQAEAQPAMPTRQNAPEPRPLALPAELPSAPGPARNGHIAISAIATDPLSAAVMEARLAGLSAGAAATPHARMPSAAIAP